MFGVWEMVQASEFGEILGFQKECTRLPSRPRGANLLQIVDELTDPSLGLYAIGMYNSFSSDCKEDADLILSLLVHIDIEDYVAWH